MNRFESYVVNSMLSHLLSIPYVDQGLLGGMLPLFRAEQSYNNAHSGTEKLRLLASQSSPTSTELEKPTQI